jgi:Na+/H+-dicarboxylate symporter
MKMNKLTVAILIAMLLGIVTGQGYRLLAPAQAAGFADDITLLTDIFLRLIKMIIAPWCSPRSWSASPDGRHPHRGPHRRQDPGLVHARLPDVPDPGAGHGPPDATGVGLSSLPDDGASSGVVATAISLKDFVTHAIPKSVVEAMATNEILQIVVFSLFFGLAAAALGDDAKPVVKLIPAAPRSCSR